MTEETELEALKKRVAELEKASKPPEPFKSDWKGPVDYTQGFSMPRSAMLEMMKAVPDSLMRDIRGDARKPNPITGGATAPSEPVQRGSGWAKPIPVEPPPGIEHCSLQSRSFFTQHL